MNKPSMIADDYASQIEEREGQSSHFTSYDRGKSGKRPIANQSPRQKSTGRPKTKNCHVYVAFCQEYHRTKIGISGHVMRRMKQLSHEIGGDVALIYSQYAVTVAAVDIERVALNALGVEFGTEWCGKPPHDAIAAVIAAFVHVSKVRRVNPFISDDEARLARIASCASATF